MAPTTRGLIYILGGVTIIALFGGILLLQLIAICFGLYLIYQGIVLRSTHRDVRIIFRRFTDNFRDPF